MASALDMNDIESLKDLHPRNRIPDSDHVLGHVLCERCSRIRDKSAMLKTSHSDHETNEVFFHSKNLRQLFESSAAGCHLCTIMCQKTELGEVEGQPDGGIVAKCWGMPLQDTSSKGVFWITLRQLNQNWQAVIHTESDYSRIEELLAPYDYDILTSDSYNIGRALISEIDDQDIIFSHPTTTSGRLLPTSTGSPESIDVVRSWLHRCIHGHPQCYPLNSSAAGSKPGSMRLPTRLIDIGDESGHLRPRLVQPSTSAAFADIQYLTLSHPWSVTVGDSHLKLSTHNLEELETNIPLTKLSQTFRDAMAVTQQLGYKYIWIDSLCIIQDSTEDWEKESVTMCDVYGMSVLNIAALGINGLDGCFGRKNPLVVAPCYLGELQKGIYAFPIFYDPHPFLMHFFMGEGARLPSRGWFLQERLLSPRTLYLGASELYWQCQNRTWGESFLELDETMVSPDHLQKLDRFCDKISFHTLRCWFPDDLTMAPKKTPDKVQVNQKEARMLSCWANILRTYSDTKLTYTKDRLVALSGIIKAIQEGTNLTPVAGTWKELWPMDLLWYFPYDCGPKRIPSGLRTPSWSWLTNEGAKGLTIVDSNDWSHCHLAQVINFTTQSDAASGYYIWEAEKETTITLKGYVRRAVWSDGSIKEDWMRGTEHHSKLHPILRWDDPPADGDAFLLLLILACYDPKSSDYYGLILTTAHSGENNGKTCDHYRRAGMFEGYIYSSDRGTRFVEGAQEEVVTIC